MFLQDSTSTDDLVHEMDEGFVDDSMAVPSTSEHVLVVGVGAPEVENRKMNRMKKKLMVQMTSLHKATILGCNY